MFQHDRRRRSLRGAARPLRLVLAGAVLAAMLAMALPGSGYALPQGTASGLDAAPAPSAWSVWTNQIRETAADLWTAVWSPVDRLFGRSDTSTTTTTDPTSGSGGFDPGGGGSFTDPDGAI